MFHINTKKLICALLLPLSSTSIAHFPERMLCSPQIIHLCDSSFIKIKNGNADCKTFNLQERPLDRDSTKEFAIEPSEVAGRYSYSFDTNWLSHDRIKPNIRMVDVDQGETFSQSTERFFFAPQISGSGPSIFDNDISGFATLSSTGHPHTLQFIFANDGSSGTITQINIALCQEE